MADICFLVLLNFLALEVRPLECLVIATVIIWDFMLEVFDRWVWFYSFTVSVYLGMIQGQLYPLVDV